MKLTCIRAAVGICYKTPQESEQALRCKKLMGRERAVPWHLKHPVSRVTIPHPFLFKGLTFAISFVGYEDLQVSPFTVIQITHMPNNLHRVSQPEGAGMPNHSRVLTVV